MYTTNNDVLEKRNFDVSGGLLLQYNNLFSFGFAVHHINQPDIGLVGYSKLPVRFTIHASAFFNSKNNKLKYQPIIRYFQQQNFQMLQLNNQFIIHKNYMCGVIVNSSSSGGLNLGYINKWFSINFLYEITYRILTGNNTGTHELACTFNILPKEKRKSGLYTIENF